jgi:heme exporter protein C
MNRKTLLSIFFSCLALVATWIWCLGSIENDIHQGAVYKILYLHVPSAFCAFFCSFLIFVTSIIFFVKKSFKISLLQKSIADAGFLFTFLTLLTGSIWGKATWGVWWTWDARLTTTFILGLLYGGYLMLWALSEDHNRRAYVCSALGILIFIDVPIIYKSVTWWRTLHQPPSIVNNATQMSTEILYPLLGCCLLLLTVSFWIMFLRYKNILLKEKLDNLILEN